jgi:acetyl-CoA carboxylase carboxyl transferase subunit alpha
MKMTAQDLAQLGVIDRIVKEPIGGAHRDAEATVQALGDALDEELQALSGKSAKQLRRLREERFLGMGDRKQRRGRRRQAEG